MAAPGADPNLVRGSITLDLLENSTRQPVIRWSESDVIRIHSHLARYRLVRHSCDKAHFEELAESMGLVRHFRFNNLVHKPLKAKIKREFDKLVKEGHVKAKATPDGMQFEWAGYTRAWAQPGWPGDRDKKTAEADGTRDGSQPQQQEIAPNDSASAVVRRRHLLAPAEQAPKVIGISSLGTTTHNEFDRIQALPTDGFLADVANLVREQASRRRSPPGPQTQPLLLRDLYRVAYDTHEQTSLRSSPPFDQHRSVIRGDPERDAKRASAVSAQVPALPVWTPVADPVTLLPASAQPVSIAVAASTQPMLPRQRMPTPKAPVFARARSPEEEPVSVLSMLDQQTWLMSEMVSLAMSMAFLKFELSSENHGRLRSHSSGAKRVELDSAVHRYKTDLAKLRAIETRLVQAEPVLELPCGAPMVVELLNRIVFPGLM